MDTKTGGSRPNRLITEKSPYLIQHAHNPVDWHPWSEEAFSRAASEDRPIFLSIGYSTCHWCHVMERESFEDPEVARLMNETFVPVKVDREERPDIDTLYMNVCQMMTGSGGWPLTILMTPDRRPFFAATYLPKESRYGRVGMLDLIPRVQGLWKEQRQGIEKLAGEISGALHSPSVQAAGRTPDESLLHTAFEQLSGRFDPEHGGFGTAPKFPTPQNLLFLLRYWQRTNNPHALDMAERTLASMRAGGIWDHIGGGFHRYSTDREWLLPHFEKMLYDQAMLCIAFLEAFQATKKDAYADTARLILDYVIRDMSGQAGGFCSAEDADSEGEEGKFYLWTLDEVREVLGADAGVFIRHFGLTEEGNFAEEATAVLNGKNILRERMPLEETARHTGIQAEKAAEVIKECLKKLGYVRASRIRPGQDDKVLTDWNGLMVSALAKAARVLGDEGYLSAARQAAGFLLRRMRSTEGRLLHRYRDGEAAIPAMLDDYAFLVAGLLDLYETAFDAQLLQAAIRLEEECVRLFWDDGQGGFFMASQDSADLIARPKQVYDSAYPSGNSVSLMNLYRLFGMTGSVWFREKADALAQAFAAELAQFPSAYTYFLCSLDFSIGPSTEIVIAGLAGAPDTMELIDAVNRAFLPNSVLLFRPDDEETPLITEIVPFTRSQRRIRGKAGAYVCSAGTCREPVQSPAKLLALLKPAR